MKTLNVNITNKVATYSQRGGTIVCGNDDYIIKFTFDDEWSEFLTKTARFKWNGAFHDIPFAHDWVAVPRVSNTKELEVGVYAGESLHTSTSAIIKCVPSCLCGTTTQAPGADEPYYAMAKAEADRAEEAADNAAVIAAAKAVAEIVSAVHIVQTTGDSETHIMSQKAVTEALAQAGTGSGTISIVQTTGDSEVLVMSQKAVTTELNKVTATVGNIDAALDSIIAIQESLIGGNT